MPLCTFPERTCRETHNMIRATLGVSLWPARRTRSSPVASHPSIAPGLLTSRRRRFRVGARSSRRDGVYLQPTHHSDRTRSAMGSELWSAPPPGKGRRSRPFLWKGGPASQKDVSRPGVGSHPSERRPAYQARLWQEQKQQMLDPTQGGLHRPLPSSEIKSDSAIYNPTVCSPVSSPVHSHVAISVFLF